MNNNNKRAYIERNKNKSRWRKLSIFIHCLLHANFSKKKTKKTVIKTTM